MESAERRRFWLQIASITLIALVFRIGAANGALWLDEAWSATTAHDVGSPLGVLLKINHDNNHHLNTLWLLAVGLEAAPELQRALSIAAGTLTIPVAAAIAARQDAGAARLAAVLFAVSPLLITYGTEARGYAPMLLALMVTVLLVARWLDDSTRRVPAIGIGVAVLLGMLSQLTMVFGIAAIFLWVSWALLRSQPRRTALRDIARVLLPVVVPAAAVLGLVLGAAHAAGTGLQFGNFEPFSLAALANGVGAMLLAAVGGPVALAAALLLILPPDTPGDRAGQARDRLFFLFALLIPLGVALAQLGNSGAPRYHLISGAGALMLMAIHAAPRLAPGRALRVRLPVAAALGVVLVASMITDVRIATNRRADPGVAFDLIAANGAHQVAVERDRSTAIFRAAAASRRYPLTVVEAPCPAVDFLFVDRDGTQPFPDPATRCDARYHAIAEGHPTGLSGTHWKLYRRDPGPVTGR